MNKTDEELKDLLRRIVNGHKTLKQAALAIGLHPVYISQILRGERPMTAGVAWVLGFEQLPRQWKERESSDDRK